jgi:hypothetical protein
MTIMTTVYMLVHVHETPFGDDETKFIGAYSTEAKAKEAIARLQTQPGFRDYPDQFEIHPHTIDKTSWRPGRVRSADSFRSSDAR